VRREDCMEMFQRIPEGMHPQVNLVLRNSFVLSVDTVARFEETYIVFRGREGGTSDEGRGFFVPYDEVSYIRIERPVRVGELKLMYGETGYLDLEARLAAQEAQFAAAEAASAAGADVTTPPPAPAPVPVPVPTTADPASIAKQNLLDRIRAARAGSAKTGNGGGK
jgi:hypothetical protein